MKIDFFKIKKTGAGLSLGAAMGSRNFFSYLFLMLPLFLFAQTGPIVGAHVDTTKIKIGGQILYRIAVETNPQSEVIFPDGQTFSPLEMVESFKIDTNRTAERFFLLKEYALTQFDSGGYTIPRQRVIVNNKDFFTDSIRVEVADVVVDTTKQKMYPIKPSVEVPRPFAVSEWVWWLLATLLVLGITLFFIFRRKKKKAAEAAKLPPYEQALVELEQLDHSHLLEDRELKQYYSKLTDVVRRYLDEQVYDRAMESTTGELITFLEMKKDAGELRLSDEVIADLRVMLQRADLAKFANSRPDVITAKADRASAEKIINDTRTAVPEPTEEELLRDQKYQEEQERKRKRRRIILGIIVGVVILIAAVTAFIVTKGYDYVKDTYLGHPSKELLEGDWIRSEYGNPPLIISTPRVLVREESTEIPPELQSTVTGTDVFSYGSLLGNMYVSTRIYALQQGTQVNLEATTEGIYADLEAQGAKNILMMDEEFTTVGGVKGIRVFGSFDFENQVLKQTQKMEYSILSFAVGGGMQQVTVVHGAEDEYATEITQRIINSVEFNNSSN